MSIRFSLKATGMKLTPTIRGYVTEKVHMLEKYIDPDDSSVFAGIEVGKTTRHHQSGPVFLAEITMHAAGKNFRADATHEDLFAAIDEMKDEIARELRRTKRKRRVLKLRGARRAKRTIRKFYR